GTRDGAVETVDFTVNRTTVALGSIADQTVDEEVPLTFTAVATDGDPAGDPITYSLGADAPAGASIDPVTGVFTWTPTEAQGPGTYTISIEATNTPPSATSAEIQFQVTVQEVNRPPVLAELAPPISRPRRRPSGDRFSDGP